MKNNLKSLTLATLITSLFILASGSATAQTEERSQAQAFPEPSSPATPCQSTLTFGSGANLFRVCITHNGNILDMESPQGFDPMTINSGDDAFGDGYVLCSALGVHGYDTYSAVSGFGPPTFTQPGGFNTLPLTIRRQTTDGNFEFRQTFEWNTLEKEVAITMVLRNISGASIGGVKLARYFDGDLNNTVTGDIYDADSDSVWGRQSGTSGARYGLRLSALSFALSHTTAVESFGDWNPFGVSQSAKTCTPVARSIPTTPGDYVGRVTYTLGTIPAGGTKTVKVLYGRL